MRKSIHIVLIAFLILAAAWAALPPNPVQAAPDYYTRSALDSTLSGYQFLTFFPNGTDPCPGATFKGVAARFTTVSGSATIKYWLSSRWSNASYAYRSSYQVNIASSTSTREVLYMSSDSSVASGNWFGDGGGVQNSAAMTYQPYDYTMETEYVSGSASSVRFEAVAICYGEPPATSTPTITNTPAATNTPTLTSTSTSTTTPTVTPTPFTYGQRYTVVSVSPNILTHTQVGFNLTAVQACKNATAQIAGYSISVTIKDGVYFIGNYSSGEGYTYTPSANRTYIFYNYNDTEMHLAGNPGNIGPPPLTTWVGWIRSGADFNNTYWGSLHSSFSASWTELSGTDDMTFNWAYILCKNGDGPQYCVPSSTTATYDLVQVGTLVSGSLTATDYSDNPFIDHLNADLVYDLPGMVQGSSGYIEGLLVYNIETGPLSGVGVLNQGTLTINGTQYPAEADKTTPIALPAGVSRLDFNLQQIITGEAADQTLNAAARLTSVRITVHVANVNGLLNCDGGMEKPVNLTNWLPLSPYQDFGRLGLNPIENPLTGTAACGTGYQVVGRYPAPIPNDANGGPAPIYDRFSVLSDTRIYWKFRYRSLDILGLWPASPDVYLISVNADGSPGDFVIQLYGSPSLDSRLAVKDWTLIQNHYDITAGNYAIVLSSGLPDSGWSGTWPIYYDDVYVSLKEFDGNCTDEDAIIYPTITPPPSPTPTPSPSASPTGSVPGTATQTSTFLPSRTPNATLTVTRTVTTTATWMASATQRSTWTVTASVTITPHPTATPCPQGQTCYAPTSSTLISSTGTMTPGPGGTPVPGGGDPVTGTSGDCHRPSSWDQILVSVWIDYGRCSIISYFTFGPAQQATAIAIPRMFGTYEPFGSAYELVTSVADVRATALAQPWSQTGGSYGSPNPAQIFAKGDTVSGTSGDPWGPGAAFNFTIVQGPVIVSNAGTSGSQVQGDNALAGRNNTPYNSSQPQESYAQQAGVNTVSNQYALYCNSRLNTLLSSSLAAGACYALNFARVIGLLAWTQLAINILSILGIVHGISKIISMGSGGSSSTSTEVTINQESRK